MITISPGAWLMVPRSMAAKFEVEVREPGKTLYVIGHGGFLEFLWDSRLS
jgi:hypothetical protein